jgi:arsenate reductase
MKTVAFVSPFDAARSKMALAFFDAFTKRTLVHAISGGFAPRPGVLPDAVKVMDEVGFKLVDPPRVVLDAELAKAELIVQVGELSQWRPPDGVRHEAWKLPDPTGLAIERLRELRDRIRVRVWRLVAREGWYKLQPSRALPRRVAG